MYITNSNGNYSIGDSKKNAIADILPPIVEEGGKEISLTAVEGGYEGNGYTVAESFTDLGRGLFKITRRLINDTQETKTVKFIFALRTCFSPNRYLVPCVSYNGNEWGEGKEPKGMYADNGEAWIHAYERTSIPSCTMTETKELALSLFVSDETPDSLVSSCSIFDAEGGEYEQRIYWPITEAPYTYYENDRYTDRLDTYLTLEPSASFECSSYILAAVPKYENYGIAETLDRALEIFSFNKERNRTCAELWRLGIEYSRLLLSEHKGRAVFSTGIHPTEKGYYMVPHYEVGWCGQNIMNSRMHLLEYFRTGEQKLLDGALAVCDSWRDKQSDSGLLLAHYEWYTEGKDWNYIPRDPSKSWAANVSYKTGWLPETCNTGWAACEMLKVYKLLKEHGIDRPDYKEFGIKILDFFCDNYSEDFAFGKAWHFDGRCEEERGTIGAFVTMALCDGYKIIGDERYLEYAKKSLEFYVKRDIDNFVCTAGAIDCTCVDKETAGPVIIAALDLYELTKEEKYLTWATKASYYFASWMFVYDAHYGPEAEFTKYGYYTSGATAVSVQHPALDQWGELMCCEWLRLAEYTGDDRWRTRARMMWFNSTQCIADENNRVIHGLTRPIGSQNEAFYQARWHHRKNVDDKGHLNGWLVSWVNVFRLNVIERLFSVNGYTDTSSLE